jgi:hypothetical protein
MQKQQRSKKYIQKDKPVRTSFVDQKGTPALKTEKKLG